MKKLSKIILVILMMFMVVPVFAKEGITVENIIGSTLNEKVVLNATDALDVSFNDLDQNAVYKVTLKNDTEESFYVTDLMVEGVSEEFLEIVLSEGSENVELIPGKETEVEVVVKTLDITQAGRNFNDEVQLKFVLGDVVKNPETSNNWIIYVVLVGTLLITLSTIFSKLDNKKKLSVFVIGALVLGTTVVYATDEDVVELTGKVSYTSQNLMQSSGTKLDGYQISYINSTDIWKYAEQVKNIIISDDKIKPEEYDHKYDLTAAGSKKIYGYLVDNGDDKAKYDLYIVANGVIYAPEDATGLFSFPNVEKIQGLEFVQFDNTTNMTAMFMNNDKLTSLNKKAINTSNVTNAAYMFNGCDKLNVSEKDFDLSKVTNKSYMVNKNLSDLVKLNAISDKDTDFATAPVTGKYMVESTQDDENPVYYYRGGVVDNNVLFGGYCWKMVRTTETGGVKMIYNGVPNNENTPVSGTEYVNVINNSSTPFEFNSLTLRWTSKNKSHYSTSSVIFNIVTSGSYVIKYDVSSENNYDWAWFYKNGTLLKKVSGTNNGTIDLGYITVSDKIEVKYSKDVSVNRGKDNVVFYIAKGTEVKPACNNTGTASQIGTSEFNTVSKSFTGSGYMYGESILPKSVTMKNTKYLYGNDVDWDGTKYTLKESYLVSDTWANEYKEVAKKYHYTCLNTTGVCDSVMYITKYDATTVFGIMLNQGDKIDDAKRKMLDEKNDSTIKKTIDGWYEENLHNYGSYLEDTIWCNDRNVTIGSMSGNSADASASLYSYFSGYERNNIGKNLELSCKNNADKFTVSEKFGNGKLTYPIGLLTADELTLAGNGRKNDGANSYLTTGVYWWTMTPCYYASSSCVMNDNAGIAYNNVSYNNGVRPAISLKAGIDYVSGTGTVSDPYVVE